MASVDLNAILGQLGRDKGIDKSILVEAIESAMLSAARKHFGHSLNLEVSFNEDSGELEVVQFKTVVSSVVDPGTEISIEEARRSYDPDAMIGDEFGKKLPTEGLGRISAQTAKQVIIQKLRDAERGVIYEEYKNARGDLINGIVQRYDRGNLIVHLGRTEAVLPKREQIQREKYKQGDRVRSMILDIDRSARGPQIILTRSHPDFLKKLFELEVPEIADKTIEIKAAAREPGDRAKIAVISNDQNLDPVGACVGVKGSRVRNVVDELKGERIDIIPWTPDEPSFVARALAPAEVNRVLVDEDNHSMEVIVNDDQLSLAIGRRGQNVKLASKLTGWKLDVRSVSVAEEEARRARRSLESIPGVDFTDAERLYQQGYRSAQEVAEALFEDLMEIEGIERDRAEEIIASARQYIAEHELDDPNEGPLMGDLYKLGLDPATRGRLQRAGLTTIQSIVLSDIDELLDIEGIDEEGASAIREAADRFLRSQGGEG
jgi:N utilization substance protein A